MNNAYMLGLMIIFCSSWTILMVMVADKFFNEHWSLHQIFILMFIFSIFILLYVIYVQLVNNGIN